jgi:hypothetical protein
MNTIKSSLEKVFLNKKVNIQKGYDDEWWVEDKKVLDRESSTTVVEKVDVELCYTEVTISLWGKIKGKLTKISLPWL